MCGYVRANSNTDTTMVLDTQPPEVNPMPLFDTIALELAAVEGDPLIMHNGLLADPTYDYTRKIKPIAAKRKKTDDDYEEIARLEFLGGLYYTDALGPYLPGLNVRRALIDAARLSREGKNVERGLVRISRENRLEYDGPRLKEDLWADARFVHRALVKISGRGTVNRTRAQFHDWSARVDIEFDSTVLNTADLIRLAETAGAYIGLGDGRPFFGGRFEVKAG